MGSAQGWILQEPTEVVRVAGAKGKWFMRLDKRSTRLQAFAGASLKKNGFCDSLLAARNGKCKEVTAELISKMEDESKQPARNRGARVSKREVLADLRTPEVVSLPNVHPDMECAFEGTDTPVVCPRTYSCALNFRFGKLPHKYEPS